MAEDSNLKESKREPNQFGARLEINCQTLLPGIKSMQKSCFYLLMKGGISGPQNAGDGGGRVVVLGVDLFLEAGVRTEIENGLNTCRA